MKNVLIISPYFPPTNAADMQRVRMSLPYFNDFDWQADIVTVDENYADLVKDDLLVESLPMHIKIHRVKALSKKLTSKFGLGSLALRSLWFYRQKVNQLLKTEKYDLIYFSTTQFPVCVLGAYWKKRYSVPYVIDMQDPWHSEYYQDKPKKERPAKHWFSYRLNKYLEPIAMRGVDGLISVSEKYILDLQYRYPRLKNIPKATITFGAFHADNEIAKQHAASFKNLLETEHKNLVYIGRGGADMYKALIVLFKAVKVGQERNTELFKNLRLFFIGTSYAAAGQGVHTILPLAQKFGIADKVTEITDRISYYHAILTLQQADGLLIPGSDSAGYTASKIYPYLSNSTPLLAIINSKSPAVDVLLEYGVEHVYFFDEDVKASSGAELFLTKLLKGAVSTPEYKPQAVEKYSARNMTRRQCELFNSVINGYD